VAARPPKILENMEIIAGFTFLPGPDGVQKVGGSNPLAPTRNEGVASAKALPLSLGGTAAVFLVYILRSSVTGRLYVGSTHDLQDRLRRHNDGRSKATRHGIPWVLLHTEAFATRAEAVRRERYCKMGHGRAELEAILAARC
jgi:putative endonuclease